LFGIFKWLCAKKKLAVNIFKICHQKNYIWNSENKYKMARDRKILKISNFQLDNGFYKRFWIVFKFKQFIIWEKNLAPNLSKNLDFLILTPNEKLNPIS